MSSKVFDATQTDFSVAGVLAATSPGPGAVMPFATLSSTLGVVDAWTKTQSDARYAAIVHEHAISDVTGLVASLAALVPVTRTISTGTGLSGGGDLGTNRTISLANTTVTPGSYTLASITVDAQGRLTSASNGSVDLSAYATKAYADSLVVGLLDDRGNYDASGNVFPSTGGSGAAGAILKGDLWTISAGGGGTLGGSVVTPGDVIRALTDSPGQTAANWAISENNFGYVALNQAMPSGTVYVGNGSGIGTAVTISGDVTLSNAGVAALATVNGNVGTFGSATQVASITVNAKGLVTAVSNVTVTPALAAITGFGTGVAAALAIAIGSAGAPIVFNGALGTPASGNLVNCTFPTLNQNTTGNAATVSTIAGMISAGTNVTITGSGTSGSPYVINASGGGGGTPGGLNTHIQYNNAGAFAGSSSLTFNSTIGQVAVPSISLTGNISSPAWTTGGIGIAHTTRTLTDTTSTGTVAAAFTNVLGGNTIAASNVTTFTDYASLWLGTPTAGTNVTITNPLSLITTGAARFGGQVTVAQGTLTSSAPLTLTQTWNNAAVSFVGMSIDITKTAATLYSPIFRVRQGATSLFEMRADDGVFTCGSVSVTDQGYSLYSFVTNGTNAFRADAVGVGMTSSFGGISIASHRALMWSSTANWFDTVDLALQRDAAGTLSQRSGTTAQTFNIANTWTSSTSFEYGRFQWNTNEFRIGTAVGSAGGTARQTAFGWWDATGTFQTRMTINPANGTVNFGSSTWSFVYSGTNTGLYSTSGKITFGDQSGILQSGASGANYFMDYSGWSGHRFSVSQSTPAPTPFLFTDGTFTALTASTEMTSVNWNLATTKTFAAGAITTQRAFRIQAPTYAFASASTITTASTLSISGAPIAGTNATITNPYALNVESGISNFGSTALINAGSQAFTTGFHVVSWNEGCIGWASTGTVTTASTADTAIKRASAGLVEINNGTAGTYRDLVVRNLRMSAPTVPATATSTGSEGQISWDSNFVYVCVATSSWKRAALSSW